MSINHDVSKLDDLIVTTIDSVKGYEHSAESAKSPDLQAIFLELATERRAIAETLQGRSRELGGSPSDFGSVAGTVHRRVEDLRRALGGGDEALLKEIARGEDYLAEEYQRVLSDDSTMAETRELVSRAFEMIRRGRERTAQFEHRLRPAA